VFSGSTNPLIAERDLRADGGRSSIAVIFQPPGATAACWRSSRSITTAFAVPSCL